MQHQAEYWNEEASRRLSTLARLMTFCMWLLYAGFMIFMIFRIAGVYLGMFQI
jgi:type II secretory pathway component PulF